MPCYTDECNQAPFELSDPTLVYPERSPRGASPLALPPRPNLGNFSYLLCFDNDPFCLSRNPFLLITVWIAYVWNRHFASSSLRSFALSFTFLPCAATHLLISQQLPHSLPKQPGCTPERARPSHSARPTAQNRMYCHLRAELGNIQGQQCVDSGGWTNHGKGV